MKMDILIVVILVLAALYGYRSGLLLSAVRFLSSLLSIGLAFLLVRPLSAFLIEKGLFSSTLQSVSDRVYEAGQSSAVTVTTVLEKIGIPESWTRAILQTQTGDEAAVVNHTAESLRSLASAAAALLILYILVRVVLGLLARLLTSAINGVPIVGWLNRAGGLVMGLLHGAAIVILIVMVLVSLSGAQPAIAEWTKDSQIIAYLVEKDIIRSLLDTIL